MEDTIPRAPASPLDNYLAKVAKWWLYEKGYELSRLPADLAHRIRNDKDVLPEDIWTDISSQQPDDVGRDLLRLCELAQIAGIIELEELPLGNECYYVNLLLCGYDYIYRIAYALDEMGVLASLGLHNNRRLNNRGDVIYPWLEAAYSSAFRNLVIRKSLAIFNKLIEYVKKLGEECSYYPDPIKEQFQDEERARIIAWQLDKLNPGMVQNYILDD